MNRKLIYPFSLISFFLVWGISGFMAATPRGEAAMQATMRPEDNNSVVPAVTANTATPVTGAAQPVAGILMVYALIFALLNDANKQYLMHTAKNYRINLNGRRSHF